MIISRRMRWVRHVACMVKKRNAYNIFIGNLLGRDFLEDLGIDGKKILA
jgi:hypothetical protein